MPPDNLGVSTCPLCKRTWLVTEKEDCLLPACGCFGQDTSENNPNRLCEKCGLAHMNTCTKLEILWN